MARTVSLLLSAQHSADLQGVIEDRGRLVKHVQRAQIIRLSAERLPVLEIAKRVGVSRPMVWRWQQRFTEEGIEGLLRGLSGILCAGPVAPSRLNEPIVEHDSELGLCLEPLARRHFPLSRGLAQDEKQELRRGVIGGKMTSCAHGAA